MCTEISKNSCCIYGIRHAVTNKKAMTRNVSLLFYFSLILLYCTYPLTDHCTIQTNRFIFYRRELLFVVFCFYHKKALSYFHKNTVECIGYAMLY